MSWGWREAIAAGVLAGAEEIVQRLHAVVGDDDLVQDVALLEGEQGQFLVVGIVFDQQDDYCCALRTSEGEIECGALDPPAPLPRARPPWRATMRCTVARPMPVPGNSCMAVQALEGAEELVGVGHVESHAVVANKIDCRLQIWDADWAGRWPRSAFCDLKSAIVIHPTSMRAASRCR